MGRLFLSAIPLGPFSVGVALVMTAIEDNAPQIPEPPEPPAPRKIAPGRRRGECLRCGAHTDVLEKNAASFECWQCGQVLSLKPRPTAKA
jgi:DNA-directed RNA polymerase subunit RPC12/RpoP